MGVEGDVQIRYVSNKLGKGQWQSCMEQDSSEC